MTKRKLLIASDCFLPRWDGIARFLAELIPRIKNDYEITVVAPNYKGSTISIPGVRIVRVPIFRFTWGDYPPAKFRPRLIKNLVKASDIVFSQSIGPVGLLAILYAKRFNKPVVSFIHSIEWELVAKSAKKFMMFLRFSMKKISRWMYNKANLLLVPSKDTTNMLKYNMVHAPMQIVHLGVDARRFSPAKSRENAKKKVKINPKYTVIGYTGRIGREKDLGTLYKAFRHAQKKHKNLKLLIVGQGLDLGKLFDSLDDVIHVPVSNSIEDYLRAMDIFVLPSLTETTSLATMEAMSCGLPVIATDVGHLKSYISDGKNGYLFPKRNVFMLMKKLEKLVSRPGLRKGIGTMARKTIETRYRWENTVKDIKKALDMV